MEQKGPQKFLTKVIEKYPLDDSRKYLLVKLELTEENNTLSFEAGQYVSVLINDRGERRSYSIASTPDIDHGVSLVLELVPGGLGSKFFDSLQIGERVEILAPLGKFVVDNSEDKLLFVATGSGIVPIMNMINDQLINKRTERQIRLHWGMRDEEGLFWLDNLQRLAEAHSNFVFDVVLSQPTAEWKNCVGHVQDCISKDLAGGVLANGWQALVCGNPTMVIELSDLLVKLGMPKEKVKYEKFA